MTAKPEFVFPLLCFTREHEVYGIADDYELRLCGKRALDGGEQLGMEMIEPDGRSWRVVSVRHVGYAPFKWRYHNWFAPPLRLVEHTYEPGPVLSLDDVKARMLAHIDAHPFIYCHFPDDAEELESAKAEVRPLDSIAALYEWVKPDAFLH